MEFSPYEIGMAKYGTFMKTDLFGSKFFMGKLCKGFEEPPPHFLQAMFNLLTKGAFIVHSRNITHERIKIMPHI